MHNYRLKWQIVRLCLLLHFDLIGGKLGLTPLFFRNVQKRIEIFCSLQKIYLCLFIPNYTRNHLITYANSAGEIVVLVNFRE